MSKIPKEQLTALDDTIDRWGHIVEDPNYFSVSGCALCEVNYNRCSDCIIHHDSGSCCRGTPYEKFVRKFNVTGGSEDSAKEMLNYLKELRTKLNNKEEES